MSRKGIVVVILAWSLQSCYSPQVPQSPKEENLVASLAKEYQGEVDMWHDKYAVVDNKSDGAFRVRLINTQGDLCSKDSLYLKTISSQVAKEVTGILSHQENYASIEVSFETEKRPDESSSQKLCDKKMKVNINDIGNVEVVEWWVYKAPWAPSDHIIEK